MCGMERYTRAIAFTTFRLSGDDSSEESHSSRAVRCLMRARGKTRATSATACKEWFYTPDDGGDLQSMDTAEPLVADNAPSPSVLLVDDRPENLLALEAILKSLGVRLVSARSGEEALLYLLRETFAVI